MPPIPPIRGQYEWQSGCVTIAPISEQMVRGVDRNSTYFTADKHSFNANFNNYILTGEDLSQFGLFKSAGGTPEKVIAR